MTTTTLRAMAAMAAVAVLATACGDDSTTTADAGDTGDSADEAGDVTGFDLPQGNDPVDLDPADFTADVDNPYWPLEVGTRWTYLEVDEEGTELEVVVVVTTETREIANGITARVVRDTVREDGEIVEDTFDWYAQDAEGNVWYLGEDTAEFEDGEITTRAGSFEAGVDGALPGMIMPADPQPGMKYRQEYFEGEAEDNGEILGLGEVADVPAGHFEDLVLTADTTSLEPDVLEHKYYAEGVGLVLTVDVNGGGREELISIDQAPAAAGTGPLGDPNP